VHLFVHYDGKGIVASKLTAGLIAPTSPSLPLLRWAGDTQPLDWQLRRIYSACPLLALLYALLRLLIDLLILRGPWGAFIGRQDAEVCVCENRCSVDIRHVSGRGAIRCDRDEVGGQRFDCVPVPADTLCP
jgi:hypothetical protein